MSTSPAPQPSTAKKVLTFLSKLGGILANVQPLVPLVGGILANYLPGSKPKEVVQTVVSDFAATVAVVAGVEATGQALSLPGSQKLIAAGPQVAKVILASSAFTGLKIQDVDLFNRGAGKIADGMADCTNAVHPDAVSTAHP